MPDDVVTMWRLVQPGEAVHVGMTDDDDDDTTLELLKRS